MEKYGQRKIAVITIIAVMIAVGAFLTACAWKETKKKTEKQMKETSYFAQEVLLDKNLTFVKGVCCADRRIYMIGKKEGKDRLVSCEMDGSDVRECVFPLNIGEYVICLNTDGQGLSILTGTMGEEPKHYQVKKIDGNGKILESHELLTESIAGLDINSEANFIAEDGSVYAFADGRIFLFSPTGELIGRIRCEWEVRRFLQTGDGNVYACIAVHEKKSGLVQIGAEQETIEESTGFGDYGWGDVQFISAGETDVYCNDGVSLYEMELGDFWETGKISDISPIFQWMELGIDGSHAAGVLPLEEGSFGAVVWSMPESVTEAEGGAKLVLIKQEVVDAKEETKLSLACVCLSDSVRQEIMAFNRENEDYQVEVWDYSVYEDPEERLQLDMAAGRVPDIMSLNMLSEQNYVQKGILTDLYPLMEQDTKVGKKDMLPFVLDMAEQEGSLFYLGDSFVIYCFAGSREWFGDKDGIRVSDLMDIDKKLPEGAFLFENQTREHIFRQICNIADFVDMESGKVSFESQDFVDILIFSKTFPKEGNVSGSSTGKKQIPVMLMQSIGCFKDIGILQQFYKARGGVVFLGYPSSDRDNRLPIAFDENLFGITQNSTKKDGAWKFIRRFFTYEYQMKHTYDINTQTAFPVRKDVLDKQLDYVMAKEGYTDKDGTEVMTLEGLTGLVRTQEVTLHSFTEEEVLQARELFKRCRKNAGLDWIAEITSIAEGELTAFFAGDKTAEETAKIIQKRVEIYINEKK